MMKLPANSRVPKQNLCKRFFDINRIIGRCTHEHPLDKNIIIVPSKKGILVCDICNRVDWDFYIQCTEKCNYHECLYCAESHGHMSEDEIFINLKKSEDIKRLQDEKIASEEEEAKVESARIEAEAQRAADEARKVREAQAVAAQKAAEAQRAADEARRVREAQAVAAQRAAEAQRAAVLAHAEAQKAAKARTEKAQRVTEARRLEDEARRVSKEVRREREVIAEEARKASRNIGNVGNVGGNVVQGQKRPLRTPHVQPPAEPLFRQPQEVPLFLRPLQNNRLGRPMHYGTNNVQYCGYNCGPNGPQCLDCYASTVRHWQG